ncbi:hypothetical protein HBP99_04180 [Listeria booriae]|uniref:hypothetical protein n=1 Tax=Listeria booriae TaxID=1552123 RepID=UPI001625313F|nr:hypothetical protein [Listeria booriae]MBC2367817.1 hypothetical protein [Listeria booriae]
MQFIDFEVFAHDWGVIIIDSNTKKETEFRNDRKGFVDYYEKHKKDIWVGFNIRHYDQFIAKAIICDFDPKEVNDYIIVKRQTGWSFSQLFWKIPFYLFDVKMKQSESLKQLEGFMGHDIQESNVPFDLDRKLTKAEFDDVMEYCRHDVRETIAVFLERYEEFESHFNIVKTFDLKMRHFSKTQAQLVAEILGASKVKRDDEFDIQYPETANIEKYTDMLTFHKENKNYDAELKLDIAGVRHVVAWGGLHGARKKYHAKGIFINIDVESYYPAVMIEYDLLSRNIAEPKKYRKIRDKRLVLKRNKDKQQKPYKILLNGTFGATKDPFNKLFDPRQANNICITGMVLIVDLIEKLEPYCEVVQSNTDGVLIRIDSMDMFETIDDVCYEWEERTRMKLDFDFFREVHQKDVNNYVIIPNGPLYDEDGKPRWKAKGAYVKKLSNIDNDLPIVNEAIVQYFAKGTQVEDTIYGSDELIKFQKVVKISSKFQHAIWGKERRHEKVFRVFASTSKDDRQLRKAKDVDGKIAYHKISYTPDRCFIDNSDITSKTVPAKLDREWYVALAKKRIRDYEGKKVK